MEFLKGYDCVGCNSNIFPNPKDILFKLRILVDVFWRSHDIFCKSINPSCVKRPNMQLLLRHKCAYFNMKLSTGSHIQIRQTDLFKHDGRCISYSTISIASWYVKNFQAIHCLFNGNIFQDIPYPVSQYVDEENEPNQARRFFGHEIKRCGYLKCSIERKK